MSRRRTTTLALALTLSAFAALPAPASPVLLETEAGALEAEDPVVGFSKNFKLDTESTDVECVESKVTGSVTENGGEPAIVDFASGSFTGAGGARCSTNSASITAAVEANVAEADWKLETWLLEEEGIETDGTGTIKPKTGASMSVKADLYLFGSKFATCYYTATEAAVTYNFQVPLKPASGLVMPGTSVSKATGSSASCPEKGTLTGEFEVTSETSVVEVAQAGLGFSPGSLTFAAKGVKSVKMINLGTAVAWLADAWIEEGGAKTEADFKIVGVGGTEPCNTPGKAQPFQKLEVNKGSCEIGIQFVSGKAGKSATYVVEIEGTFRNSKARMKVSS